MIFGVVDGRQKQTTLNPLYKFCSHILLVFFFVVPFVVRFSSRSNWIALRFFLFSVVFRCLFTLAVHVNCAFCALQHANAFTSFVVSMSARTKTTGKTAHSTHIYLLLLMPNVLAVWKRFFFLTRSRECVLPTPATERKENVWKAIEFNVVGVIVIIYANVKYDNSWSQTQTHAHKHTHIDIWNILTITLRLFLSSKYQQISTVSRNEFWNNRKSTHEDRKKSWIMIFRFLICLVDDSCQSLYASFVVKSCT